ncbi:MAG: hypothetical protein ACOYOP_15530, partial [Microthrixaceae bacterium]
MGATIAGDGAGGGPSGPAFPPLPPELRATGRPTPSMVVAVDPVAEVGPGAAAPKVGGTRC